MATRRDQRHQRKKKKREEGKRRARHLRASARGSASDEVSWEGAADVSEPGSPFGHPSEMESAMRLLTGVGEGPEHEAQELAFRAMQAADEEERRAWLRRALELDPECVDALWILARTDARSAEERAERLEGVVGIAARSLGPDAFEQGKGHFWGLLETRPYMRARTELAWTLLALGREDEAIGHVEEMLELNPSDNQGLRYTLLGLRLRRGELDAARALVERFDGDISPTFAWGEVLLAFLDGDLEHAAAGVVEAREENPHTQAYLLGERVPPPQEKRPPYYNPREESGAWICADEIGPAWKAHPNALRWLRSLA